MAEETTQTAGLSDAELAEAAKTPSSFSVDGLSQTNRSASDLIALDQYWRKRARASSGARRHPLAGLVTHLVPPGPCDR